MTKNYGRVVYPAPSARHEAESRRISQMPKDTVADKAARIAAEVALGLADYNNFGGLSYATPERQSILLRRIADLETTNRALNAALVAERANKPEQDKEVSK